MIAKITGTVQHILPSSIIVDVAGIGYELIVPSTTIEKITEASKNSFFIAEHISESDYTLYGFLSLVERDMYYRLKSVNGVGPKATIAIMSAHSVEEISSAIINDNISLFSGVSGIGKKTAQRIILDLKGKLISEDQIVADTDSKVVQALVSLGYKQKDSVAVAAKINQEEPLQLQIKNALKELSK